MIPFFRGNDSFAAGLKNFGRVALCALLVLSFVRCGTDYDTSTIDGRRATLDAAQIHLSEGECTEAIEKLEGIYKSASVDNEVRMITASAYACVANVNFFKMIGELVENSPLLGGGAFWSLLAKLFPSPASDPDDKAVEGAILASDALMATLKPGAVILPESYIDPEGFNPGATLASDRADDANLYLLFVSLAAIGAMENRFGAPDATYLGTLPWQAGDHVDMETDGCAFASSVLNFVDTVGSVANSSSPELGAALLTLKTGIADGMDAACTAGCFVCGLVCDGCPITLRNRRSCTGLLTDKNSCAAAGIVNLVNASWVVPL
ncbi:MAG: hypothetical protein A2X94_13470 [Bdellovibrionales bacterium GWB1_55_8]|nr:MAG: hypothetical protein A2X94_13470 [Bdellovibrionales bacterium GWB1_55_8]